MIRSRGTAQAKAGGQWAVGKGSLLALSLHPSGDSAPASEAECVFPLFLFEEQWEQEEGGQRCSAQTCSASPANGAAPTQTTTPVGSSPMPL